MISQALNNAGVVTLVAERVQAFTATPFLHIAALTLIVTLASAFMNNVGALALLLPVALATAAQTNRSPALLLMPLAFGSILGGMTTMIGTPPNIIIANYRAEVAGEPFGMFSFTPVGVAVACAGVIFMTFLGWRLIPRERLRGNAPEQLFEIAGYLVEVQVQDDSPFCGKSLQQLEELQEGELEIVGVARGSGRAMGPPLDHVIEAGEILVLRGDPEKLRPLFEGSGLELKTSATPQTNPDDGREVEFIEGVVSADSPLIGRDVAYFRRRVGRDAAVVALARSGRPIRGRLRRQKFRARRCAAAAGRYRGGVARARHAFPVPLAQRNLLLDRPRQLGPVAGRVRGGDRGWCDRLAADGHRLPGRDPGCTCLSTCYRCATCTRRWTGR